MIKPKLLQAIQEKFCNGILFRNSEFKWACLKRRHVYEAVTVRPNGRVAEINFGLMSTNVYDGGRSRKVKNPHKYTPSLDP